MSIASDCTLLYKWSIAVATMILSMICVARQVSYLIQRGEGSPAGGQGFNGVHQVLLLTCHLVHHLYTGHGHVLCT